MSRVNDGNVASPDIARRAPCGRSLYVDDLYPRAQQPGIGMKSPLINCSRPNGCGQDGSCASANLRQLAVDSRGRQVRFASQNEIKEPDNETIDRENEHGSQTGMMPDVADLKRNQGRSRKYH